MNAINVKVTTFTNPFSFFFLTNNNSLKETYEPFENADQVKSSTSGKILMSDADHGQYVLVLWKDKWSRGVVHMENQYLIWLIDYGIFIRPNNKTIFIELPSNYKKYPSKVFEASVHGVVPVNMILDVECEVTEKRTKHWCPGAVERVQFLLKRALKTVFYPVAILTTKFNDVILGDLIVHLAEGAVNVVDELDQWPFFLQRNPEAYIEDISSFYINRRHHRACDLKPSFPNVELPQLTLETASIEYLKIIKNIKSKLQETKNCDTSNESDISVSTAMYNDVSALNITPKDIEKYSKRYILINNRTYNVLHILINKARDLRMCEQYKDHDRKSIGRACYYNNKGL